MVRKHLWVSGKVQGVWYRGSCRDVAHTLGVTGWARNLPDGRVEVVAEGPEGAVEQLVEWCKQGPPAAEVSGVEELSERPQGLTGFAVL